MTSGVRGVDQCKTSSAEEQGAITLSFTLDNDATAIPPLLAKFMTVAGQFGLFDEVTENRVAMAVHEAILNGMHHGNLELDSGLRQGDETAYQRLAAVRGRSEPYCSRRVHVQARFDPSAVVFVVRDEGCGFVPAALPDPTEPPCRDQASGRGLLLIRCFMDEVTFNSTGNEITLVKRRTNRGQSEHAEPVDPCPGAKP
jgi:anti-sigma regulatory factor (Ser/Thr protein kinase)